ncbi:hypothetical protein [Streptomyces bluensis]|uniref:Integral membrane protein n=1 Tax=Streptomyces bluensis TaxID=33897 RepID=A0ABW6UHJ6_9ACTN
MVSGDADAYERFRRAAEDHFATRAAELRREGGTLPSPPALPSYPALLRPGKLKRRMPLQGVIRFGDDWTAEFVRFDPTAERGITDRARWRSTVRRQIDPLMRQLEERLPGVAVHADTARYGLIALTVVGFQVISGIFASQQYQSHNWLLSQTLAFGLAMWVMLIGIGQTLVAVERASSLHSVQVLLPEAPEDGAAEAPPAGNPQDRPVGGSSEENADDETMPWADLRGRETRWWHIRTVGIAAVVAAVTIHQGHFDLGQSAALGVSLLFASTLLYIARLSRIRQGPRYPADLGRETSILYLRPFPDRHHAAPPAGAVSADEGELEALFTPYGAFVYGGHFGEMLALHGRATLPLRTDRWKRDVSEALPRARLVLIPATSTGPATLWQLTEAVRLLPLSRLLLVLPSGEGGARDYDRFRQAAEREFAQRAQELRAAHGSAFVPPRLPDLPRLPGGEGGPVPRGVIHFGPDGEPHLLDFHSTTPNGGDGTVSQGAARERDRARLRPVLSRLPEFTAPEESAPRRFLRRLRSSPQEERTDQSADRSTDTRRAVSDLLQKWIGGAALVCGACVGLGFGLASSGWGEYVVWVVLTGAVLLIGSALRVLGKVGGMVARPFTPEDLDREACVLYVRPRPGDTAPRSPWTGPLDRDLDGIFYQDGLFVAACDPADAAQLSGTVRLPLPRTGARAALTEALPRAHLVLIPACGTAPDTLWQLTEAVRLVAPSRLLLPLPAGEEAAEEYQRFRRAAADAFAARADDLRRAHGSGFRPPVLPPVPHSPAPTGALDPALRGVLHFAEDWQVTFLPFRPVPVAQASQRRGQLGHMRVQLKSVVPPASGPGAIRRG